MNESYCYSTSLSRFSLVSVLDSNKWLLNFLTCNSLMNCEAKHIFIFYLFAICTSSFVRWLFRSFDQLLSCYFKGSMYILDSYPLSYIITNTFSQSVAYPFILLTVSFLEQRILVLTKSSISVFSFIDCAFMLCLKSYHQTQS